MIAPTNSPEEQEPTSAQAVQEAPQATVAEVEETSDSAAESEHVEIEAEDKPRRRSTSHLKLVPETLELREQIKAAAEQYARTLDRSRPFNKNELEGDRSVEGGVWGG